MAAISGWMVELDSRASLQYDYSVAFLIMAVCWGLDLLVVAGLNVPETRGVSTNPWAEVTQNLENSVNKSYVLPHPFLHSFVFSRICSPYPCLGSIDNWQVGKLFNSSRTIAFLLWAAMVGFCFGQFLSIWVDHSDNVWEGKKLA